MSPTLRRLLPEPAGDVTVDEAYRDVTRAPGGRRPWVMVTMIASVDGAAVVDGRSGQLGNAIDAAVLAATRAAADVILVGAATVRAERYAPPRLPGQRIGVVTTAGRLDTATPLFTSGAGFLVMPEEAPATDIDTLRVGHRKVDLPAALERIHELAGPVGVVQVEGGPTLNASLLAAGCVDELNLTVSPLLVGSTAPRIVAGTPAVPTARLHLAHLLVDEQAYLFSRWRPRS